MNRGSGKVFDCSVDRPNCNQRAGYIKCRKHGFQVSRHEIILRAFVLEIYGEAQERDNYPELDG